MKSLQPKNITSAPSNHSSFFQKERSSVLFVESSKPFFHTSLGQAKLTANQPHKAYEEARTPINSKPEKVTQKAPPSFISRTTQPTKQQQADEEKVRKKIPKAITLLGKTKSFMAAGAQQELLDEMFTTLNTMTPEHLGTLDVDKGRLTLGKQVRLFYTFQSPGAMSRPFEYRIRIDLSHETGGAAAGYFQGTDNYGGTIVIKITEAKSASTEGIAGLLVHEAVHMLSHLQRAVNDRIGAEAAKMVPGKKAAGILDTSSFATSRKAFIAHFSAVQSFLNNQPHRSMSFDKFPQSIVDDWTRKVVEETIAYVYQSRLSLAMDKVRTAGSKGPTVNIGSGFVPLSFLKNYMTRHWLTDPDDQAAMVTPKGEALLSAMSADMISLHHAVEAQVGADAGSP